MDKVLGDKRAIALFSLPAILLYILVMIIPIFASGFFSLLDWDGIGTMRYVGLRNFHSIFIENKDNFYLCAKNTLIIAALSAFVQVPIAIILAMVLAGGIKGEGFFRTVFFIPVVISASAVAQLFLKIYNPDYGLINEILRSIGLEQWCKAWLYNEKTALLAAFFPLLWQFIGYHMLLIYAGIKSISPEIFEAARIDGASRFQTSINITIPLIKPMLEVSLILAVIGSLKAFDLLFILTSNGEPLGLTMVQTGLMYKQIFGRNIYGGGSAIAVFIVLECLLFTLIIQKTFRGKKSTR